MRATSLPEAAAAEIAKKEPFEFVAKDAVDDEIDGGIDGHEQVGNARHLVHLEDDGRVDNVDRFEDVDHDGQDVGHEKDGHDAEEHRGEANLALLGIGQHRSLPVSLPYLFGNQRISQNLETSVETEGSRCHNETSQAISSKSFIIIINFQVSCSLGLVYKGNRVIFKANYVPVCRWLR